MSQTYVRIKKVILNKNFRKKIKETMLKILQKLMENGVIQKDT